MRIVRMTECFYDSCLNLTERSSLYSILGDLLKVLDDFSILKPDDMFNLLIQSAYMADQEYLLETLRKLKLLGEG